MSGFNYSTILLFVTELYKFESSNIRAASRFAPSQWETALLCNDISRWLGANLESALNMSQIEIHFSYGTFDLRNDGMMFDIVHFSVNLTCENVFPNDRYSKENQICVCNQHSYCSWLLSVRPSVGRVITKYRKISNIRRTKSPNLNVSRFVLQLSLPNPMKPGVKMRMKM